MTYKSGNVIMKKNKGKEKNMKLKKKLITDKFDKKNHYQLCLMCVLPVFLVLVFSYLPMGGMIIAFKDYRYDLGILGSKWVGLDNMIYFLKTNDFWNITANTLYLNSIFIVVGMSSSIALAVLLFEITSRKCVKVYQTILITPFFMSWVIVGYISYGFLSPEYGLMNTIIQKMGMDPVSWYTTPEAWPWILTIFSTWKSVGMDSIYYYAALMGIDKTYFEAARIDGANKMTMIRKIVIPELVPLIILLFIMRIGGIFNADFGLFYQLTRDVGALYSTTDVIDTYIFRTMRVLGDMSLSSAVGVLQSVVGFILVLITNYAAKKIDPSSGIF